MESPRCAARESRDAPGRCSRWRIPGFGGSWNACLLLLSGLDLLEDLRVRREAVCRLVGVDDLAVDRDLEDRSEEHTSELQSRLHLVCRLLLEKKKNKDQHKLMS